MLTEAGPSERPSARARILCAHTGADPEAAETALRDAWREHQICWHRRRAFTGRDMTLACLSALGVTLSVPDPLGSPERRTISMVGRGRWAERAGEVAAVLEPVSGRGAP